MTVTAQAEPPKTQEPTRLEQVRILAEALRNNQWIPHEPTLKQAEFLLLPDREALYGGAAGPGKSDALLMGALQFADTKDYKGVLFRRTYAQLSKPDAIMFTAMKWLMPTKAKWNGEKRQWTFPSGAVLVFSHLQHDLDIYNHQGPQYDYVGFDELTQFKEAMYIYLFSRIRRLKGSKIPPRMRSGSNPGGIGHRWVYERFAIEGRPGKRFLPATMLDNPFLDVEDYLKSISELSPILQKQLRDGRWVTDTGDKRYKMKWWEGKNRYHWDTHEWRNSCIARWQSWDTAEVEGEGHSYSACVTFEVALDYRVAVSNVLKERVNAIDVPDFVLDHARSENADGKLEKGGIVVEDASSGRATIQALRARHDWLSDAVKSFNPGKYGDKDDERPQRAALWCGRNCVLLPHPCDEVEWLFDLETDLEMHPDISYKDVIDAFNQGVIFLDRQLASGWRARGKVEEG